MTEREMFGNPDSADYKFGQDFNMIEKTRRYYKLKDESQNLKKHVNMNVNVMSDSAEKEFTELTKKKDKVEIDKKCIEETILQLDNLSKQSLEKTFEEVNKNFKIIFSTLLPGA